ncbi:hypothetical protein [Tropicibacter sp. S64]|uniref:hypothetical protein n=1 Tax=Tropicibacter sp. S64 TaxID=3415122 RepID=UPI003C7E640D
MTRSFRKLSHQDFRRRVKTVDPAYYRWGESGTRRDTTVERPIGFSLLGFGWAYLVVTIANNRALIESSLQQGNLHADYHRYIFMGLAALLMISGILLMAHVYRFFTRSGGKRRNSGGLLVGALGAFVLVYTPAHVWSAGYNMLDGNSRSLVQVASATKSQIGSVNPMVDAIAFVTSVGK